MYLELENQLITKLKIILNSNFLYILLLVLSILYVIYEKYLVDDKSIYDENDKVFILEVIDKKLDGNKLSLDLKGEEDLVGTYYINDYNELLYLQDRIKYGVKIKVQGELNKANNNTIPDTFNYRDYLESKGIYYTLKINKLELIDDKVRLIYRVKNFVNKRIMKIDSTGYMKAFILGDKGLINEDNYHKFQKIGVTHLFALSGMHIGLLSGIFLKLFKKFKYKYFLVDVILVGYGFLVGFPSSIKRCILFFILNSLNKFFKLKISNIKILFGTIFILVMIDVNILFDVGFRYSILTVLGILISSDFVKSKNKIISSFKLSIVAFLFSLPISFSSFYEVNLLSIFYNIFYIPYVSLIVYPLSLLTFIFPFIDSLFSFSVMILELGTNVLAKFTIFNIYMDFNMMEMIIFYSLLIMMMKFRKYVLFLGLTLIVIIDLLYPYFDKRGYVYFFDVGQGDSSLVISPHRQDVILLDTGGIVNYVKEDWMEKSEYNVSDNVISFLKSQGIKKIDLIILSHGDADHAKEVRNIMKEINIKSVKINKGNITNLEQEALELIRNTKYEAKGLELKYLNYVEYNDENANSLLTYMKIYNTSILSLGDATKEAEEDLIKKYNIKDVSIAKISHHGSKTSSSEEYLTRINPNIAVISSGRNNRFNHPNKETINTLEKLNIFYLNTQTSGTIKFIIDKNSVTYSEYKP